MSFSLGNIRRSKEFNKELDEIRQCIENVPSSIAKAELHAASSSLEGAKARLAILGDKGDRWAKQLKYTQAMVLLEDTNLLLLSERNRMETHLLNEYKAIENEFEGKNAQDSGDLLSRIEYAIDICTRAGLNTILIEFASLKENLMNRT
jgi:hypothetical protein